MIIRLLIGCIALCFILSTSETGYAKTKEIKSLQAQLVQLASKLRSGEERLSDLTAKQAKLDADITEARLQIEENKEEIDALLQSLIRLSRTPPEAVLVMPGDLRQTIQAAQLMGQLTEKMQSKTNQLNLTLKQLKNDELELAETRERLNQQRSKLVASRKALEKKLTIRQAAYRGENKENYEARTKSASSAKKSSRTVTQLVAKLNDRESSRTSKKTDNISFSSNKGRLSLPVAGRVTTRYGQSEGVDQTSHGYYMASTSGATVTSPAAGEVLFTGPFLDYDNIIIIKYDNGYHLLLAGMGQINCAVGQRVLRGEPLGKLNYESGNRATLYLEVRKNGKPIDPSPWFG